MLVMIMMVTSCLLTDDCDIDFTQQDYCNVQTSGANRAEKSTVSFFIVSL